MIRLPRKIERGDVPHKLEPKMAQSVGIAMRTKTWSGYGKNVPDLGYSDEDLPNLESPEFVGALVAEDEEKENEEAQ